MLLSFGQVPFDILFIDGVVRYVEDLEDRLRVLQHDLHERRAAAQELDPSGLHPSPPPSIVSEPHTMNYGLASGYSEKSDTVPDIDSPLAHLTLAAMAEERESMQHPFSFTLPTMVSTVSGCNGSMLTDESCRTEPLIGLFHDPEAMTLNRIISGIPKHQAIRFIDKYFESLHSVFPWTDRTSFLDMHSRVTSTSAPSQDRMEDLLVVIVLALGMYLCGCIHESDTLVRCISGQAWSCFIAISTERDRRLDTQGLLLLTVLSLYRSEAGLTWHFVGLLISRVISLGLHRDLKMSNPLVSSITAVAHRREIFWSAFCLDR